jgi:hypothetical protein
MMHVRILLFLIFVFWLLALVDLVFIVNIHNTDADELFITIFAFINCILFLLFFAVIVMFVNFLRHHIVRPEPKRARRVEDPIPMFKLEDCKKIKLIIFNGEHMMLGISSEYDYPPDWLAIAVCESAL